jgi:hypothetical protein
MRVSSRQVTSRRLLWVSMGTYVASLALPAYSTLHGDRFQSHYGFEALLFGAFSLFIGHLSWMANPLLVASWATRTTRLHGASFALALLSFAAAMMFLAESAASAGPATNIEYRASVGYFVWLVSIAFAAAAALTVPIAPGSERSENVGQP